MLAPAADSHFSTDRSLQTVLQRLHSCVDAFAFFATLKALANEAMPQQRALTRSQKVLLHALSSHLEATARRVNVASVDALPGSQYGQVQIKAETLPLRLAQLTPAEREIVELLRQGSSNKEIACMLGKSVRTVKTQLTSVYKKLGVRSRSRLLAKLS